MMRVAYAGPALGGRTTSLGHVLRLSGQGKDAWQIGADVHLVESRGDLTEAFVSRRRSMVVNDYVDLGDSQLAAEIELLRGTAAVLYVVDSQVERLEANREHLDLLRRDMAHVGVALDELPVVFQLNKRDLPNSLPVGDLVEAFRTGWCCHVESVARTGVGVVEAFEAPRKMLRERR